MADTQTDQRETPPADERPVAGLGAIVETARHTLREAGGLRGLRTLGRLNQIGGFDCPGCAWPDPPDRSLAEFCANGAKHVAHEATRRRVRADFFVKHSLDELARQPDHWLEAQGRLIEPVFKPADADHYRAIEWDEAFARIGDALRALPSPNDAIFYTSGRTSNEAAFLYQLFAREFGTNNLPDCSNLCHESSGTALSEILGDGKGTVSLADFERADAIFVIGQNPASNHPRMMTALLAAKRGGCRIVSINPLRERGLIRFAHPKQLRGLLGRGTEISDLFLQVRIGGDIALLQGIMQELLAAEARRPGSVLDQAFLREHTDGFEVWREALERTDRTRLQEDSGITRDEMRAAAEIYSSSERVIACWAMGITQHEHAVANVQEIANLMLLRGNIGRQGAGLCPVRGHSNVQGDRTMGICERPSAGFLDRLGQEFGFEPPRAVGLDSVHAIEAMAQGPGRVFIALGGNFLSATPDTEATSAALRRCKLTVQVSTKLNRSHLVTGREAIILPCLGRTERDLRGGRPQFVTVENSMRVVHRSQGRLGPAGEQLRSEPAIVAGIARAALGPRSRVPWEELCEDYDRIRERIARVVPGFEDFNRRVREPDGFVLPSAPARREFRTASGRARFRASPLPDLRLGPGQYRLTTIRSHDQFNTSIYSLDDLYRGIRGNRRVIFLSPDDMREAGIEPRQRLDITSHHNGTTRVVRGFEAVPHALPRRCAAAYYPEANPLVPLASFAEGSHTPAYKSITVSLAPSD